ncbi:hypothetical protein NIES22_66470 [Calothrix brevissima NIES-22]|nr:hypothetical protein NIES22_66470 [Calothrix brevissima NIES-22]
MNNTFQLLENDTDVLLFDKDTYTVTRLKELIRDDFAQKLQAQFNNMNSTVANLFQSVSIKEAVFKIEDITWKSDNEGISCQLLRVASRGWQPGRLRICTSTEIISENRNSRSNIPLVKIKVSIEFCPDQPVEPESPLDDIRKMMQAI